MNWIEEYLIELSTKSESEYTEVDNTFFVFIGSGMIELGLWITYMLTIGIIHNIFGVLTVLNMIPLTVTLFKFIKLLNEENTNE